MAKKLSDVIKKNLGLKKKTEKTGLLGAVGQKVLGKTKSADAKSATPKVAPVQDDSAKAMTQMQDDLGILTKNSMFFEKMGWEANLIRQNVLKITKGMGLKEAKGGDFHALKESEAGTKLGVQRESAKTEREAKKPTPVTKDNKPKKEKGGASNKWLALLKLLADPDVLILAIYAALNLAEWFTELWDDMVEGFNEWIVDGKLWEVIKDKAASFIKSIQEVFTMENLMKFVEDPGKYLGMLWDSVTGFFGSMGDFISEKFDSVKAFFGMSVEPKAKNAESPKSGQEATSSGLSDTEAQQARADAAANDPRRTDKPKYTKEQIAAAEEAEKKAQYTGQDEVVRQRMGLTGPSAAEMRGEVPPPSGKVSAPGTASSASPEKIPKVNISGDDKSVMAMIKKHEGFKNEPYKDSLGLWTVGVGHLIGDGKSLPPEWNRKFSDQEIDALFAQDFQKHKEQATKTPGWDMANDKGRAAMIDLAFNMGGAWFKRFKNAASALGSGDFNKAADELTDSVWYKQVKGRAATVVQLIREGLGKATSPSPVKPQPANETAALTKPKTDKPAGSLTSAVNVQSGVDISGFKASLEDRVLAMANAFKDQTGKKLLITSGYRSNEKQKELWDAALAKNGGDAVLTRKMVAEPAPPLGNGKGSLHASGLAIDINSKGADGLNALAGPRDKSTGWLEKFGLIRPVPGEDWHVQASGTPPVSDNPANPGKPTLVADKSGSPVDVNSGKKESMPPAPAIAQSSTEVASGQRQQIADANQPIIINNTSTVNNTNIVSTKKPSNSQPGQYSSSAALTRRLA